MKKALLLLGLMIVMTGCSTKTLTCTSKDNSVEDMKRSQKIEVTFRGKNIVKLKTESEVKVTGIYKKYIKQMEDSLLQQFITLKDKKGVTVKTNKNDDSVSVRATIQIGKLDKETKKTLNLIDLNKDYNATKKSLQDQGSTCK